MTDSTNTQPTEYMLTTVDNPYNPFTQFDEWLGFDTANGYATPGLLDRYLIGSNELSPADQSLAIQQAVDQVVDDNVLGLYKKVSRKQII